ncbi:MAG: hypothetical protein IIX97_03520 [Clostridia bacterium]|nr:hypothetical protein [Clostridia bacterium]
MPEALKLIGLIMIGLSGVLTSIKILSSSDEDVRHTEALIELVSSLRSKIEVLCIPIPDILSATDPQIFVNCGYTSDDLPKNAEDLISKCKLKEDAELYKLFSEFVFSLGRGYKSEELSKCDLITEELKKILSRRKEERIKRKKTVPAICLSVSACIIILLI